MLGVWGARNTMSICSRCYCRGLLEVPSQNSHSRIPRTGLPNAAMDKKADKTMKRVDRPWPLHCELEDNPCNTTFELSLERSTLLVVNQGREPSQRRARRSIAGHRLEATCVSVPRIEADGALNGLDLQ